MYLVRQRLAGSNMTSTCPHLPASWDVTARPAPCLAKPPEASQRGLTPAPQKRSATNYDSIYIYTPVIPYFLQVVFCCVEEKVTIWM